RKTMVLPRAGTTCRHIFDAALSSAGVEPAVALEFDEWDPIKEAVAHGIGAGILQGVHLAADPRLSTLRVTDADFQVPQYVVCPPEYTQLKTVRAFFEIVEEKKPSNERVLMST
ncbi:MAG: LysR family transcriptional regulator substrate-binding protein, partial [bacterium]